MQPITEQTSLLHSQQDQPTSILPIPTSKYFSFASLPLIHKSNDDDVITVGIKKLSLYLIISIILWLITFMLIIYKIIQSNDINDRDFLLFIPMYLGSILGIFNVIILSITICNKPTLISRERRIYLRSHGSDLEEARYIDYDSLPLMRRLFCWNLILIIVFVMILVSQILYSLWFIYSMIGIWHALVPIIIVLCFSLLYITLVNVTFMTTFLLLLIFIQMILFIVKATNHIYTVWTILTIPVMLVQLCVLIYLINIALRSWYEKIILSANQIVAFFGYTLSLVLSIVAQVDIIYEEHIYSAISQVEPQLLSFKPTILWSLSISILTISGLIIMNNEANLLASSRGFEPPLPLSRTNSGWEVSKGGGNEYSLLFGTIFKKIPSLSYISLYGQYATNIPPRSTFTTMKQPTYQTSRPSSSGTSFKTTDKNRSTNTNYIEIKSMEPKEIEMSTIH